MKDTLIRIGISILICALTNALVLGVSSEAFQRRDIGDPLLLVYSKAIIVALMYIAFLGWWLLYIPYFILFRVLISYTNTKSYFIYAFIGFVSASFFSSIIVLLFLSDQTVEAWYSLPTIKEWITIPEYAIIGALYGIFYRKFLI